MTLDDARRVTKGDARILVGVNPWVLPEISLRWDETPVDKSKA